MMKQPLLLTAFMCLLAATVPLLLVFVIETISQLGRLL